MVPWGEGWRGAGSGLPPGSPLARKRDVPTLLFTCASDAITRQNNGLKPFDWRNPLRLGRDLGLALAVLAGVAATPRQGYGT